MAITGLEHRVINTKKRRVDPGFRTPATPRGSSWKFLATSLRATVSVWYIRKFLGWPLLSVVWSKGVVAAWDVQAAAEAQHK